MGSQAQRFAADPPRPVFGDILLAKLKPGQQIDIECRVCSPPVQLCVWKGKGCVVFTDDRSIKE